VEAHSTRILSRLERDVFPRIGQRRIAEVEALELLELIRCVEARGALDVAKRLRQTCGQIFRYAIATGRAKRDPSSDLRGALKVVPKAKHFASLKAAEMPDFLQRLDTYDGEESTKLAIQFVLLTFARTTEARLAVWSEFEGLQGGQPLWRLPATRMKAGREHLIPLSTQTVTILKRLRELSGNAEIVFPGEAHGGYMSQNTMIFALYRMGYHSRLTMHGLRGTASTILNEHQFNRDWIEIQLAHSPRDGVRAAYNAAEWLPGRRGMMQWWGDYIGSCLASQPAAILSSSVVSEHVSGSAPV